MLNIASQFDIKDKDVIRRVLVKNNIEIRNNNAFYQKKKVNETYFDIIDTEHKAYWLGFIYADGCVSHNNTTFQISLMESDIEHLYKLKEDIGSEHKIVVSVNKSGYSQSSRYCKLAIVNQQFVDGLIKCGVHQDKTHLCLFPETNILPIELQKHFIRGFFDGDGSVYNIYDSIRYPNRKDTLGMSFTGTKEMLGRINEILNSISTSNASIRKYKDKCVYDLKYGGKNIMNRIYHYLYDDSTIYLQRKFDKFYTYFK